MQLEIRGETPRDYNGIANVHYNAFINWLNKPYESAPLIVATLRHSQYFDPDLSLCAFTEEGRNASPERRMVGHVLLSPFPFLVNGVWKRGCYLAPLGVLPEYQRSGVGGALLQAAHRAAAEKGCHFSLLCGHEDYYPRFGYGQHMFSFAGCKVRVSAQGVEPPKDWEERPVYEEDLEWILPRWREVHRGDRLAWFPGDSISQWFNHSRTQRSSVVVRDGSPIGYVKYQVEAPDKVGELLPVKSRYGGDLLRYLLASKLKKEEAVFSLSYRWEIAAEHLPSCEATPDIHTTVHFMLKVLDEGDRELATYAAAVREDYRNAGAVTFPPIAGIDD